MKKILVLFCFSLFLISCGKKEKPTEKEVTKPDPVEVVDTPKVDIPTYNYAELKPFLNYQDEKTYVVNFWATWCAPCIKELPYFEKVKEDYKDKNVEVILVSLDFPKKKESKLIPYVIKNDLKSTVLHLDDVDEQFWIADINEAWSGALPATLIYNKDKRKFFEKSFTQEELENEIKSFIN